MVVHPVASKAGSKYAVLLRWILECPIFNVGKEDHSFEFDCGLCAKNSRLSPMQHLLTSCTCTAHLIASLKAKVKDISPTVYASFSNTPVLDRWLWVLACGSLGISGGSSVVSRLGLSVGCGFSKDSPTDCVGAFTEYNNIIDDIPVGSIVAYTDGSKSNGRTGSGCIIFKDNVVLEKLGLNLNGKSNNFAELFAIKLALEWVLNNDNTNGNIHIFTDSMIAQNSLVN